jgi:hypothetical protein
VADACSQAYAEEFVKSKHRFTPQWSAPAPEIIQDDDFAVIDTIQTLYGEIAGSQRGEFGDKAPLTVSWEDERLVLETPPKRTLVDLTKGGVRVGARTFKDERSVAVFRGLKGVFEALGQRCALQGVRGARYASRGYRDVVRIEFSFAPLALVLESYSSGRANADRLYVLDVMWLKESLLWQASQRSSLFGR